MKYLISGGGTGGHIFPAVSIANALREADPSCEILFVGALGRMEMERVPQAGYSIIGLPVKGFDRSHPWRNIRGTYDHDSGDWAHRYIVKSLTATRMVWVAKDDQTYIQEFERIESIPVEED